MTAPDRARSQRLRRRPKPGWCRWRATRPRTTAMRTSCGRRVCWRVMRASGIDLLTGKVHALVKERHRSREFIEFLKLLNTAYPAGTAIKVILDNHSAHISGETQAWLATQPGKRC